MTWAILFAVTTTILALRCLSLENKISCMRPLVEDYIELCEARKWMFARRQIFVEELEKLFGRNNAAEVWPDRAMNYEIGDYKAASQATREKMGTEPVVFEESIPIPK